ncbi:helix-turn-helix domain-containing protein [Dickeya fangzhongdai]|uniref:transcriptional regulator n=1 Tax=Dickeya fangzhongdai TaxID=1778540 RepID=UPI00136E3A0E|nr:YdaS family helix-turn-helix protein [Dickeya fangzhongdai]UMB78842.1 helix-turn-helix domain-containing protein [Dickeya fangzhongdai]
MKALDKAICNMGSATKLAETLGVSPMAISHWKKRHRGIIPSNHVLQIYQATGVTPHELRPDLYPNPTDGLPQQQEL